MAGQSKVNWRQKISQVKTVLGIMHGSRVFGGPFQALLSISRKCNLRCIHCIFYSPRIGRPNLIPVRRARQASLDLPRVEDLKPLQQCEADRDQTFMLIDDLLKMGTRRFQFSGAGEPFLNKNALDFMGRAKHAGSICVANTNGTLLDRAAIDALLAMGFDELQITTMAGTSEMYARTHPGCPHATFENLRQNLFYLSERKRSMGVRLPKVTLCCVVIAQNYGGLTDFVEFAASVNADRVLFRAFFDVDDQDLSELIPTEKQSFAVRQHLNEAKTFLGARGIEHNIGNFLMVFERKLDTMALFSSIPCYHGWLSVHIDEEGLVFPCCRCYTILGSIHEQKFTDIWYGKPYREFRKAAARIHKNGSPLRGCDCAHCANWNANLSGFRVLHPIKSRFLTLNNLSLSGAE